jgi:hypothetical protein
MRWRHRDFVAGANLPWLSYGGEFCALSWSVLSNDGASYHADLE